jgi:proteasome lid subunit RPN8/RPN11
MSKGVKIKVKAQPVVVLEAEIARKIRQHSRSSMKAEVCGVLLGTAAEDRTLVEACIAGINAAQGGAHVTFTQDTWAHIYKIKDQQYPDLKIVGWYHSHPGFGVFLSEHDLFIQENFFSSPQQIAWVYDPHTDEEGCFGWVDGKIEKLTGIRFGYSQSMDAEGITDEDKAMDREDLDSLVNLRPGRVDDEPAWMKWVSRTLMAISLMALGFVAGLFFWDLSPWAQSTLRRLAEDIRQQEQQLQQFCQPELEACQARLLRTPFGLIPPASAGTGTRNPQPPSQPQPKDPANPVRSDK